MREKRPRRFVAILSVGILGPLAFLMLGFDLDRGELKCEQAASRLSECCPGLALPFDGCVQQGGCDRKVDGTIMSSEESDCVRGAQCDELAQAHVCERLATRIHEYQDIDGPTLQELYEKDNLCE